MSEQITTHEAESTRDPDQVRIGQAEETRWRVTTPDDARSGLASPEDLYAAALASCLHQAVVLEATKEGVPIADSRVRAGVSLTHDGAQRFGLRAQVGIELPGADEVTVSGVRRRALAACPMIGDVEIATDE